MADMGDASQFIAKFAIMMAHRNIYNHKLI